MANRISRQCNAHVIYSLQWGWKNLLNVNRMNCLEGSSSGWPLPGPWLLSQHYHWPMNRQVIWIPRPRLICLNYFVKCIVNATAPYFWSRMIRACLPLVTVPSIWSMAGLKAIRAIRIKINPNYKEPECPTYRIQEFYLPYKEQH